MGGKAYSQRLGFIADEQFQRALDRFDLGQFVRAEAIPFGLFGQNVFVTSTKGEYVLRGTAHYDWQFPKEQFVAKLLHERTNVPVPYPYLVDSDESIFGWKWGYVLMPRMPGLQLADAAVLGTISHDDRTAIARAMGENLREIQRVEWVFAGEYDLQTGTIAPFEGGFAGWIVRQLRQMVESSLSYQNGATQVDAEWVEGIIQKAEAGLNVPYTPVLAMHDYKEANLTLQQQDDGWKVSGVFDLMEALMGDGELDLVRQLAVYMDANELAWARAFLDGYQKDAPVRLHAKQRLTLYIVYDRMVVWEYFHRPANFEQWENKAQTIKDWMNPYLRVLERLV